MKHSRIVLFGAGNLAVHLAKAFALSGYKIIQVYSRTKESAQWLAARLNTKAITNPAEFDSTSDIAIFALNDQCLPEILDQVNFSGQLALHTSGSLSMSIFKGKAEHFGVLYPLQTFSKFREVRFKEVPLFIEANSSKNLANLKMLAESLSIQVFIADSSQRRQLHLSAVFANNFVNHFYALAGELIKNSGFSFNVLRPIIQETVLKALECDNPMTAQTGPAVRLNKEILLKHIEMLASNPDLQNLYTFASNSITKLHHKSSII
jgi:predicted short-subunit dehydrogenase-like oxidoreductase (DUF2520 family)